MTRETKSYELKIYDQSLMRFEAAYDAFGSLKLEITDIDSANAHLLPLNLIVDQEGGGACPDQGRAGGCRAPEPA